MSTENVTNTEDAVHSIADAYLDQLREKILFGLSIYRFVSPSMLHVFLGTSTPSSLWKDQVLTGLIAEGKVVSQSVTLTSPHDRSQSYTVLHLPENEFVAPEDISTSTATTPDDPRARVTPGEEPKVAVA